MFWNIYWKRILVYMRTPETYIWTWIFPLMLATLFYIVFANIDTAGEFHRIPLGAVDDGAYREDAYFKAALESVSGEDGGLFDLRLLSRREDADALLETGEIYGYIVMDGAPVLVVSGNGLHQTIAKNFLDQYLQTRNSAGSLLAQGPETAVRLAALLNPMDYTEQISLSDNPPTEKVSYFYALLAMVCLYGGFQGLITVTYLQANLSPLGARKTVAPAGRFRLVAYDLLGGATVHFLCLLTVVAYIRFVLGISFGPKIWLVLLTCLAGSVLGLAFGAMVSITSKLKEQAKIAVLITVTMVCCFLSGLMVGGVNYIVAQKAPVAAWLNPAARITDAFYCLYYYDTYERYFLNIGVIAAMIAVMLAVTAVFVRRQRYESI